MSHPEEHEGETGSSEDGLSRVLEVMQANQRNSEPVVSALDRWQTQTGITLDREVSEFGYPIVDLRDQAPLVAMDVLREVQGSMDVVFHGMHNNDFRRSAGMPDVAIHDALDPRHSHQPEDRKAVYATKLLDGGITHAVLEHRLSDQDPQTGETYALSMNRTSEGKTIEVSSKIAADLEAGENRFTDGLLYVLPAAAFSDTPNSDHEVFAQEKVVPLAVVRVGRGLGPLVVNTDTYSVRTGNAYSD